MKNFRTLTLALTVVFSFIGAAAFAQNAQYLAAMEGGLGKMKNAQVPQAIQAVANHFERVAAKETGEWLPLYYHAFCLTNLAFMEQDATKKAAYLDAAQASCDKANTLQKDESEMAVLQAYIYTARIGENPAANGMIYGPKSGEMLAKAQELNPNNPRAFYLQGMNLYYTPAMWGGGKDKALPLLEKAKGLYETVQPASTISPNWGKDECIKILGQ